MEEDGLESAAGHSAPWIRSRWRTSPGSALGRGAAPLPPGGRGLQPDSAGSVLNTFSSAPPQRLKTAAHAQQVAE